MTNSKKKNKKVRLSGSNKGDISSSSSSSSDGPSNNNNNNNNNHHNNNQNILLSEAMSSSTPKMSSIASVNRFDSLYEDAGDVSFNTSRRSLPPLPGEFPMPAIPDIPNADKLNETQRKFILLSMADKLGITPALEPPIPPPNSIGPTSAASASGDAHASRDTAAKPSNVRQRSLSRKRKRAPDAEVVDPPPQTRLKA